MYALHCIRPNFRHRCKKTFFLRFLFRERFFSTFFLFCQRCFIFKNVHWKYNLKLLSKERKQIGSVWLFFFVPVLEFPYRPVYWQALLFTYRIGLHQVTPQGVVFLFMLVNWWVEKHQRFFIQRLQTFLFYFCHSFTFFNVFFSGTFFYIYAFRVNTVGCGNCYWDLLSWGFHTRLFIIIIVVVIVTLRCSEAAAQCIVIDPVCLCVCVFVCLWVFYHDNSKVRASIITKLGLRVKV